MSVGVEGRLVERAGLFPALLRDAGGCFLYFIENFSRKVDKDKVSSSFQHKQKCKNVLQFPFLVRK